MTSTAAGHCSSKEGPWAPRVFSHPTLFFLPFLDFWQISPILSPTYIWDPLFPPAQLSSLAPHSPPCCQPAPSRPIPRRQAELYKTYIRWCDCLDENLFLAPHWFQDKVQKLRQTSGGLFSSCSPMLNWIMEILLSPGFCKPASATWSFGCPPGSTHTCDASLTQNFYLFSCWGPPKASEATRSNFSFNFFIIH